MADLTPPLSSPPEIQTPIKVMVYYPRKRRYWLHVLLLALTLFTTLTVGARMQYNFQHNLPCFYTGNDSLDIFPWQWALHPANLALGVPFSLSLLLILMAHEMGHYLYCKRYGVWATLPFFIPFPSLFGTMGAFIRIRSPIESRDALFDIGIAGPIAGFVVAVVVLWISLAFSTAPPGLAPAGDQTAISPDFSTAESLAWGRRWRAFGAAEPSSHGHRGMGWNVRDGAESASRRTAGWGPHCVLACAASAPRYFRNRNPHATAFGLLLLGGMVDLAHSDWGYGAAASDCAGMAGGEPRAVSACDGRFDHAGADFYTRASCGAFAACICAAGAGALVLSSKFSVLSFLHPELGARDCFWWLVQPCVHLLRWFAAGHGLRDDEAARFYADFWKGEAEPDGTS